jgi:ferric-dicitrate binding protein FerR (iron transport regulator)
MSTSTGRLLATVSFLLALAAASLAESAAERLTSRPRPAAPAADKLAIGQQVQTEAGQRRRLVLAGGAAVYLNQNTTVRLRKAGDLLLDKGEVFVEAKGQKLQVVTGRRSVAAQDADFGIGNNAIVAVTRGKVTVDGTEPGSATRSATNHWPSAWSARRSTACRRRNGCR